MLPNKTHDQNVNAIIVCKQLGSQSHDPYCFERPPADPTDKCCVLVVCAAVEEPDPVPPIPDLTLTTQATTTTTTTTSGSDDDTNIEFLQIGPNSIQVQFPGITGGNLMYVEERFFRKVSY